MHLSRRGSRDIEHIGSARDDVQVEVLKAAAPQRLAAGEDELGLARCPSCGSVSSRVHGGYARVVADGAARGRPLRPTCRCAGSAAWSLCARRPGHALATTLTDWQAYPAAELAACYPGRWAATETVIGEDKSAITDAGPSRGPILRSSSPHQVTQEMWAWITATQLVRIQGCQAARAGAAAQLAAGPARQPQTPVTPARISFTAGRREAVRAMTQTLASANASAAVLAAAAELASRRILDLPAARPAAPPPGTAHQMPPAVPVVTGRRAGTRQHRQGRRHHLPSRADHLR